MIRVILFMAFQYTTVATWQAIFTRIWTFNKLYILMARLLHFMSTVRQFNLHYYWTLVFLWINIAIQIQRVSTGQSS
jgi:hypothetical protein